MQAALPGVIDRIIAGELPRSGPALQSILGLRIITTGGPTYRAATPLPPIQAVEIAPNMEVHSVNAMAADSVVEPGPIIGPQPSPAIQRPDARYQHLVC